LGAIPFLSKTRDRRQSLLARAKTDLGSGLTRSGVATLFELVNYDADCEEAWRLLLHHQPRIEQQINAQKQLARLKPGDRLIVSDLKALQRIKDNPLALAHYYNQTGQHALAIEISNIEIDKAEIGHDIEYADRAAEVWRESRLRSRESHVRLIHPMVNALRLALGPAILYALMVVLQSGFSLTGLSLTWLFGALAAGFGGLLIAIAAERPMRPPWIGSLWSTNKHESSRISLILTISGIYIIALSFTLLLINALDRAEGFDLY